MILLAILITLVLLAGAAFWAFSHRRRAPAAAPTAQRAAPYGAVEIRTRGGACAAARALQDQRYLAAEAPSLPLPDCTAAQCSCAFVKLRDRRTDERRFGNASLNASLFLADNRRQRSGRRDED